MYETEILSKFHDLPVFSLSDINQVINNRIYAKKFLRRMILNNKILRIKRNVYTLHKDPFLLSTFILRPSYVSCVSALSYHKLITQIPKEIFCATLRNSNSIKIRFDNIIIDTIINYNHTNYFFGFRKEKYDDFEILIAEPEKAIIDSISIVPIHIIEEAFEKIDEHKMIEYLKKIKKSSIIKRIGYLMEKNNYEVYENLKNFINYKYIPLDPLIKKSGKKNNKWNIIENVT